MKAKQSNSYMLETGPTFGICGNFVDKGINEVDPFKSPEDK